MALKLKPVGSAPPAEETHNAIRDGLSDLLIRIDPACAGQIAVTLIRLAAALVALGKAHETGGSRSAALELLLMLETGPPEFPAENEEATPSNDAPTAATA